MIGPSSRLPKRGFVPPAISATAICAAMLLPFAAVAAGRAPLHPVSTARRAASPPIEKLPLAFESNRGQAGSATRFVARTPSSMVQIGADHAVLTVAGPSPEPGKAARPAPRPKTASVTLQLVGADPAAEVAGAEKLPGVVNYLRGSDPTRWLTGIETFERVRVDEAYPGIDVHYYGNQKRLEYDFVVAPGADPGRIRIGLRGARSARVDAGGDLLIETPAGAIRQKRPELYQVVDGRRVAVEGGYRLGSTLSFRVGAYNRRLPLVIDPVVVTYATFLGGSKNDAVFGVSADNLGHLFVVGTALSSNMPTTAGAFQTAFAGGPGSSDGDAFVAKLNPAGTTFVYLTYLGGNGHDDGRGISVLADGAVAVAGRTDAMNFPVTPGALPRVSGRTAGFISRLNVFGNGLDWSTCLESAGATQCLALDTDSTGNVYITGVSDRGLPTTTGAFQREPTATFGVAPFVGKFPPGGPPFLYLTYIGGSSIGQGQSLVVDASGRAIIGGFTQDSAFPTTLGAFQRTRLSANQQGFVSVVHPSGASLAFSTYLGGSANNGEEVRDVSIDSLGRIWAVGRTLATDFPVTADAFQGTRTPSALPSGFITAFQPSGAGLFYSTYFGLSEVNAVDLTPLSDNGAAAIVVGVGGLTRSPTLFPSINPIESGSVVPVAAWQAFLVVNPAAPVPVRVQQSGLFGDGVTLDLQFAPPATALPTSTICYLGGQYDRLAVTSGAAQLNFGGALDGGAVALTFDLAPTPPPTLTLSGLAVTGPAGARVEFDLKASRTPDPGTLFSVERKEAGGNFARLSGGTLAASQRISDTTVVAGVTYTYQVKIDGTATVSNTLDAAVPPILLTLGAVTVAGPAAPSARFDLTVTGVPPPGSMFSIERSEPGVGFTRISGGALASTQTIMDTMVQAGTTYEYRARVDGTALISNTVTGAVPAFQLSLGSLAVVGGASPKVSFDITPSATPPMPLNYSVERQTGMGGFTEITTGSLASTERIDDTAVTLGTTYQYRARIVGRPEVSNVLTAAVPAAPTGRADLRITSFAPPRNQGTNVNYQVRFSVMNAGPDPAQGVTVIFTAPTGVAIQGSAQDPDFTSGLGTGTETWTTPTMARGRTANFIVTLNAATAGTFMQQVTIQGATTDPSLSNNTRSFSTTFEHADLTVRNLSGSVTRAGANIRLQGTFIVQNTGRGRSGATKLRLLISATDTDTTPPAIQAGEFDVPALLSAAMIRQTFDITLTNPGFTANQNIFLVGVVDPGNLVAEKSEANNKRSVRVRVR